MVMVLGFVFQIKEWSAYEHQPINLHFGIFCIFGGGAGYRGQNRTQREKSVSNMGVKQIRENKKNN